MTLAHRDALLCKLCHRRWPYSPLLDALNLSANSAVLDIGAGEGQLLTCLSDRGHQGVRVGIDPVPGSGVLIGQAEQLAFPDASFDVVFFLRSLFHVADPTRALTEAIRVLQTGGKLVVAVQGSSHLAAFWSLFGSRGQGIEAMTCTLLEDVGPQVVRHDIHLPVRLSVEDLSDIAWTYALPELTGAHGPLLDDLHLVLFVLEK
ncbi:class I SAM-dependent methyltransferase [Deinococcus sp. UYEF24]